MDGDYQIMNEDNLFIFRLVVMNKFQFIKLYSTIVVKPKRFTIVMK